MIHEGKQRTRKNRGRWLPNFVLLTVSVLIALVIAEVISRWLIPVTFSHRFIDMETGQNVQPYRAGELRLTPNLNMRHTAMEFDATMSLTPLGTRGPTNGLPPEVIFVGDSFTFGWGIADGQTFVDQFCKKAHLKCANLGMPTTGTKTQLDILNHYLKTEGWRPTIVYLVFWGMTSQLSSGNDLLDNLKEARQMVNQSPDMIESSRKTAKSSAPSMQREIETPLRNWEHVLNLRRYLFESNLFRLIYHKLAPVFRAKFGIRPTPARLRRALDVTRNEFDRFRSLSEEFGFAPRVVLIHPMQDLMTGTWRETENAISEISTDLTFVKTAESFLPDPTKYYFTRDAHFNSDGAGLVSDILTEIHQ